MSFKFPINSRTRNVLLFVLMLLMFEIPLMAQESCTINGVSLTITGSDTSNYLEPDDINNGGCTTSPYTGSGAWTGFSNTGTLTYTYSQPVTQALVYYDYVNNDDVGEISVNVGGTISFSNLCGVVVSGPNQLTGIINTFGDVSFVISSTIPFTEITLVNIGGNTGWGQGNPCDFKILQDSDNDGVTNLFDLDDDNDGVTDLNEGLCDTPTNVSLEDIGVSSISEEYFDLLTLDVTNLNGTTTTGTVDSGNALGDFRCASTATANFAFDSSTKVIVSHEFGTAGDFTSADTWRIDNPSGNGFLVLNNSDPDINNNIQILFQTPTFILFRPIGPANTKANEQWSIETIGDNITISLLNSSQPSPINVSFGGCQIQDPDNDNLLNQFRCR